MIETGWRVHFTRRDLPCPASPRPFLRELPERLESWLDEAVIPEGMPFLLSPTYEYDVTLNSFFRRPQMVAAPQNTRTGYAQDIAKFLNFLWFSRGGTSWRDASEDDHVAYLVWRRQDTAGPRVAGATWNREVSLVNQFYLWAVQCGHVTGHPIVQRARRPVPVEAGRTGTRGQEPGTTPTTYAHDAEKEKVEWLRVAPEAIRFRGGRQGERGHRLFSSARV